MEKSIGQGRLTAHAASNIYFINLLNYKIEDSRI